MALSDADWNRLDRMRREDREHLDQLTEKIDADSVRQWKVLNEMKTDLEVHKTQSDGQHQRPCATAAHLMKEHEESSLSHNPKKVIPLIASIAGLAGTIGAWLSKLLHVKAELKP